MDLAKRPLLLFFTSARSGPGRRLESLLANLARKERERLRVSRVDIDEHPDLAERLDVREVPTLVLVSERKPVARLEGRSSAPRIERMIGRHLDASQRRNPAAVSSRSIG